MVAEDPTTKEFPSAAPAAPQSPSKPENPTVSKSKPEPTGSKRKRQGRNERDREPRRDRRADTWDLKKRRRADDPDSHNWGKDKAITSNDIDAEERRPKRKVAVMLGYAGTGYKGMQINKTEKTIEGDLFAAFIAAGAISKANADDPRKSSFVRCARTDKGVHAAGNVVSLKLIIEDEDIVDKINSHLPEQIRIWGLQRTNKSFSCYKSCDSRWYEYLMPSYCLLPPHPDSFIGKKITESAKEKGVWDDYVTANADVGGFWLQVDNNAVKPILTRLDRKTREIVMARLNAPEDLLDDQAKAPSRSTTPTPEAEAAISPEREGEGEGGENKSKLTPADIAYKEIKAAVVAAKRKYRVSEGRITRLQDALDKYVGTNNYYNYTVQKGFKDKSAQRHIKSFEVNREPIQINDTQWLSLKVHGQSFMMHQIRKMVAMAVLCVRSNTPLGRIEESYGDSRISIPKAPGVGLLLERPVFDHHNERSTAAVNERESIKFTQWEEKIQEFKNNHIYQRIWDVEEAESPFHVFFNQIDNFDTDYFLWVTAHGISAAKVRVGPSKDEPKGLGDDDEEVGDVNAEGGEG